MDQADNEKPDHKGHKHRGSSASIASLENYLSTISDNFDVYGDDVLVTTDGQHSAFIDENSEILQAFDSEYGINHMTDGDHHTSALNNQGVSPHVSIELNPRHAVAHSDPTSPSMAPQLTTTDKPRHSSEPAKQEVVIARPVDLLALNQSTSLLPSDQTTFQGVPINLTTLPTKKHLNKPLTSSPLARNMNTVSQENETPAVLTNFAVASSAIIPTQSWSESLPKSGDLRSELSNSPLLLGYSTNNTEQYGNSGIGFGGLNASRIHENVPVTHLRPGIALQEHGRIQNPYESTTSPEGYSSLMSSRSDWTGGLHAPTSEAQLDIMRFGQASVQQAQGLSMTSQGGMSYSATQPNYPEYYHEPHRYDQSGNFASPLKPTLNHPVLKTEQPVVAPGKNLYYGQPMPQNPYIEAPGAAGIGFGNALVNADNGPYYLDNFTHERTDIRLEFDSLYKFENKQDKENKDDFWKKDSTYPHSEHQEREYVENIIAAMSCMNEAHDNPGMLDMWYKLMKNESALESTAWKLLGLCNKSHRQIKSLAHGDNPPKRPRVYEEHMNELCAALREEKTICKHLFSADYAESLVDDPANAAHRVNNNRKVNGGKKVAIEKGRAAMSIVNNAQDSDGTFRDLSAMKDDFDQPMEGSSRQASQQLTNNGSNLGLILYSQPQASEGASVLQYDATTASITSGIQPRSSKKSTKKGTATKKDALKSPTRKSSRKAKADVKAKNGDSDKDESYEPVKTPKRKRANRNTKYPTTQLADGTFVIQSLPSPPANAPSRRKRQTTLEASTTNRNMAALGGSMSNFGQDNPSSGNITSTTGQGIPGGEMGITANRSGQLDGRLIYPSMFGYQTHTSAYQPQTQGPHNRSPYTAPTNAYYQIMQESKARQGPSQGQDFVDPGLTSFNFIRPLENPNPWTLPYNAGPVSVSNQHQLIDPGHAETQEEGENYHLSFGRRRFRKFAEIPMEDDSDEGGK